MNVPDPSNVAIALLYQSEPASRHVRETLATIGTPIAYEAAAGALDRDALTRSQASVVVVNLEDEDDPGLDDVYALLDDPRFRVVFNDSGVSSALTGWDHARWVRHLTAKVLGDADIDPPRPAGAEPVPVRVREPEPLPPSASIVAGAMADNPAGDVAPPVLPAAGVPAAQPAFDPAEFIELLQDAPAGDAYDALPGRDLSPIEFDAEGGESIELGGIDELLADFDVRAPEPLVEADLADEFALDVAPEDVPVAAGIRPAEAEEAQPVVDLPNDFDLDFDLDEAVAAEPAPVVEPGRKPGSLADSWSLEDIANDGAPAPPTGPANFGIEKLSASEYLAPEGGDAAELPPVPSRSELSLELIPLEEAVSPTREPRPDHENWFDPDAVKAKIQRVWVLGASVGGPESVREFLAEFPRDYPALFLLAQHLGDEFVDMMAKQLTKATQLTVRTPSHGERVAHGDVVIVPNAQRLQVDPMGVIVLERNTTETPYRPSIDRVIEDVADRYGADAGAIIFSGMSDDAVAGCRVLAAKGGTVNVQSPDSCVVATMVEGVVEAGLASFVGTPKELAARLLSERNQK